MDLAANLMLGFEVALSPINLLYCLVGVLVGTLIGVLPGIGPIATISMLLPITFHLPPVSALIMLAGIYYGAQYGGSTTAILVNLPGEASSVVTCIDGYQMARQGRAGPALAVAALGSLFAGCVATLMLAAFAQPLASAALLFGPAEYFSLMAFGLVLAIVLAQGSLVPAFAMIAVGLLLGLAGSDVTTGADRLTFGLIELSEGVDFVPLAMGLYAIPEIVKNLEQPEQRSVLREKIGGLWPTADDFRRAWPATLRGTGIGSALGILPGSGSMLAAFSAYMVEKQVSRRPEEFGQGAVEGVAAPESANNAHAQTSFIPLLSLGIPPNAVMALMAGAMTIQGIQPGPQVMSAKPDLFWGMIASMWIGNVMLVVINLPLDPDLGRPPQGAVPAALHRHPRVLLRRRLQPAQQHLRHRPLDRVQPGRLRLRQMEARSGAARSRFHPRPDDRGEPASRPARLERRSDGVPVTPVEPRFPAGRARHDRPLHPAQGEAAPRRGSSGINEPSGRSLPVGAESG